MLSCFCEPPVSKNYAITERKVSFSKLLEKYATEPTTLNVCTGKILRITNEFAYVEKIKVLDPFFSLTLKIDGIVIKKHYEIDSNTIDVYFPTPYFFRQSSFELHIESDSNELYNCEITGCNMNNLFKMTNYINTTIYLDHHPDYIKMDYTKYLAYNLKFNVNNWHHMKVDYYKKTFPNYTIQKLKYGDYYMIHTNNIENPFDDYMIDSDNKNNGLLLLLFFEDKAKEFGIDTLNKLNFSVFTTETINMDYIIKVEDKVNVYYTVPYNCDFIKSLYLVNRDNYSIFFDGVEYGKEIVLRQPIITMGNVKSFRFYITIQEENLNYFKSIPLKIEKGYFATPLRKKILLSMTTNKKND